MAGNAKCGTSAGGDVFLDFSDYGLTDVRVTGYEYPNKESFTDIPYRDGAKNSGDGKRALGTLTLTGVIHSTSSTTIPEYSGMLILGLLEGRTDFYVWMVYDSGVGPCHYAAAYKNVALTVSDGWHGHRVEVSITFSVYPP